MRRRLVLLVGAVAGLVVLAFLIPLGFLVRDLVRDRALSTAERNVQIVAQNVALIPVDSSDQMEGILASVAAGSEEELSIVLSDGTVLGEPAPVEEFVLRARAGEAITNSAPGGAVVVVPVVRAEGEPLVVYSFVPASVLRDTVVPVLVLLGALGVVLILIAVTVADRLGRSLVEPVRKLSEAAGRVAHGDLDVRVEPAGPPELVEVGAAFNTLVGRIGVLLSSERESVADLAHRLRTPLTALRLDIEALEDRQAARGLEEDADELERTVDFVIQEARRPVREGAGVHSDLAAVARERAAFWGALAEDQGRRWEVSVDHGEHLVAANRDDLAAAVDALIGNVFDHTPVGTGFAVVVSAGRSGPRLTVLDEGTGFPDVSVAERGTSTRASTGLGLDIARRTAEAAGGRMMLPADQAGGRVVLEFPQAG